MKFWVKVEVQCEAHEVLQISCDARKTINLLSRGERTPGNTFDPLAVFSSIVGIMDMEHSQWEGEQDGWVAHSHDKKVPRFFCADHAKAGIAKLSG
jgi:hypothetical protein